MPPNHNKNIKSCMKSSYHETNPYNQLLSMIYHLIIASDHFKIISDYFKTPL